MGHAVHCLILVYFNSYSIFYFKKHNKMYKPPSQENNVLLECTRRVFTMYSPCTHRVLAVYSPLGGGGVMRVRRRRGGRRGADGGCSRTSHSCLGCRTGAEDTQPTTLTAGSQSPNSCTDLRVPSPFIFLKRSVAAHFV